MNPFADGEVLGTLRPLGGGDPVPLTKTELSIGRRPGNDISLDFENISGKHCVLRYINGIWHIRDAGSRNGTTVNGQRISSDHVVMPDDEVGIASRLYHIDYEPNAPETVMKSGQLLDDDVVETRQRHSLMELAGLAENTDKPKTRRPTKPPEKIVRLSVDEAEFDDEINERIKAVPKPKVATNDDDFLKIFEDETGKK